MNTARAAGATAGGHEPCPQPVHLLDAVADSGRRTEVHGTITRTMARASRFEARASINGIHMEVPDVR